ncbi:DUF1697 domain-containing protein [uncultured Dokdonia sp.]|mgnify:CR=1 FL=1|uniref:DUF1697 domain-containing protein n=1 Tax=uncultured Dokdonia sp. TaxID=575653 RepID=UPI002634DA9A|nr:DUF1697 domain-containing protein [uncultured Dokdonia sp.]
MTAPTHTKKYIAFLRGINVGGHHKLPMAALKTVFKTLGYTDIVTVLNSGNAIFKATPKKVEDIEKEIEKTLKATFGFPIPTCVRDVAQIQDLYESNPFEGIEVTKETRLYISFLKEQRTAVLALPWISLDKSYQILEARDTSIISVLDLAIAQTPKAMGILEATYGKNITTRNWKTIERIIKKL